MRTIRPTLTSLVLLLTLAALVPAHAQRPSSPFLLSATLRQQETTTVVRFEFTVPPDHVLYAERLKFESASGDPLEQASIPKPVTFLDPISGHDKTGFTNSFAVDLKLNQALPFQVLVRFQGCSNSACYFPEKKLFEVTATGVSIAGSAATVPSASESMDLKIELTHYKVSGRETGYMRKGAFLEFLDKAKSGGQASDPLERFKKWGLPLTLAFIFLGGAGLNLTPCVLPMIPINMAIMMGTGRVRSRKRGAILGSSYASGMALAYGILGLVVVLTGAKFGALNSSMWFNVVIAAVFIGLALAMFDVFHLDFTRFQNSVDTTRVAQKGQLPFVFVLGAVTALLAGACVAPVVIAVLLLSAQMYVDGQMAGLLLPLLLGVGMASPWPLAGAGLAFFPKPGKWMVWVKRIFGVLILALAFYYGRLGWNLAVVKQHSSGLASAPGGKAQPGAVSNDALYKALLQGRQEGRPVFIDFGAAWCKNCVAMDETVFNAEEVKAALKSFIFVKYDAEHPNEQPAKEVLDRFGVLGLPTYVVLVPNK